MTTNSGWWHAPDPAVEMYRVVEATRRRLIIGEALLDLMLILVCFTFVPPAVSMLRPVQLDVSAFAAVAGLVVMAIVMLVPYTTLMLPLALAGTGVRVRHFTLWVGALVHHSGRWRFARVRRQQGPDRLMMPTPDTVDLYIQHESAVFWASCLGLLARSIVMFLMAWIVGVVLSGMALVFYTCCVFGTVALGFAAIASFRRLCEIVLTRDVEWPAFTELRRVTLRARASICLGTRPRDMPDIDIDAMLTEHDALPELDILSAPYWARARLTAAACLSDRGQLDAAIVLLEEVVKSKQRVLAVMVLEARFALAYCLALEGLSLSTARQQYRASRPRHAYPFERAAFKSLLHFHANEPTAARKQAMRALRLSRRPLSIGDAAAVREQMHMLLAQLDAPRT